MIIDAHTHGLHGQSLHLMEKAGGEWATKKLDDLRQKVKDRPQYFDVPYRLELLDRYGIDYQVTTPGGMVTEPNLVPGSSADRMRYARSINDNLARLVQDSKGRLIGIGTVPLLDFNESTIKEMERCINSLGLKGMNVVSNIDGRPLDLPEFEPFWDQVEKMDIPVFIHPRNAADKRGRTYEAQYDLAHTFGWPFETAIMLARLVFSGMMERHPRLKVVSHHLGGGMVPFFMGRVNETYIPEEQPERLGKTITWPLTEYFSRFYYDTAVGGSTTAIKCTVEVFGAGRVVLATDAPHGPQKGIERLATYPDLIRSLGLPKAETEGILGKNAQLMLKL